MPRDGSSSFCLYLSLHIHIDKLFKSQSNSDVVGKQSSTVFRDSLLRWIQTVSVRWYVEIGVISTARPVHCVYYTNIKERGSVVASDTRELCRCSLVKFKVHRQTFMSRREPGYAFAYLGSFISKLNSVVFFLYFIAGCVRKL